MKKIRLKIITTTGKSKRVDAWQVSELCAVNRGNSPDCGWTVTDIASGYGFIREIKTKVKAIAAAKELLAAWKAVRRKYKCQAAK